MLGAGLALGWVVLLGVAVAEPLFFPANRCVHAAVAVADNVVCRGCRVDLPAGTRRLVLGDRDFSHPPWIAGLAVDCDAEHALYSTRSDCPAGVCAVDLLGDGIWTCAPGICGGTAIN